MNINSIYLFTNKSSFFWRAAGGVDVVCKGVGEEALQKTKAIAAFEKRSHRP